MAIPESSVVVGGFYLTATDQLRKVTALTKDDKDRTRVNYMAKSAKITKRDLWGQHTLSNPPLLKTFASACTKKLTAAEISDLRKRGVILAAE